MRAWKPIIALLLAMLVALAAVAPALAAEAQAPDKATGTSPVVITGKVVAMTENGAKATGIRTELPGPGQTWVAKPTNDVVAKTLEEALADGATVTAAGTYAGRTGEYPVIAVQRVERATPVKLQPVQPMPVPPRVDPPGTIRPAPSPKPPADDKSLVILPVPGPKPQSDPKPIPVPRPPMPPGNIQELIGHLEKEVAGLKATLEALDRVVELAPPIIRPALEGIRQAVQNLYDRERRVLEVLRAVQGWLPKPVVPLPVPQPGEGVK